jgi:hypothetical protein
LPVRERIFLLLDATQTSLGGAAGKFPQYYAAYYDLVVGIEMQHCITLDHSIWLDQNLAFLDKNESGSCKLCCVKLKYSDNKDIAILWPND